MVLVSIIIPNFNKGIFLKETLHSILNQSYKDIEIIIIDDGSTDNSVTIINEFKKTDSRITLIEREDLPKGANMCRNLGVNYSKGDYIQFFDSDDIMTIDFIKNRVEYIGSLNADVAIFPIGTFYSKIGDSDQFWFPIKSKSYLNQFLIHDLPWNILSGIWKSSMIKNKIAFDLELQKYQDVDFMIMLLSSNKKIQIALGPDNSPDGFYRISEERRVVDNYLFLLSFVDAAIYLSKKYSLILSEKECYKFKGTFQVTLTKINAFYKANKINSNEFNDLTQHLLVNIKSFLSFKDRIILSVLVFLGKKQIYFKGLNYISKWMITG
jgi:glycosyltransferase involved in cell wall biosynthesis